MKTVEELYRDWVDKDLADPDYFRNQGIAFRAGYAAAKAEAPQWPPSDEVLDRVALDIRGYDPAIDDGREMARSAIAAYLGREF